jgi:hypothetical protein
MSNNFDLNTGITKTSNQALRTKSVEAALVLINSAIATSSGYINDASDGDLVSKLADKIEAAVKKVEE